MFRCKIYAGLSDDANKYIGTYSFDNKDDAYDELYDIAREKYQSYEGLYGIPTHEECRNMAIDELNFLGEQYDSWDIDEWTKEIYDGNVEKHIIFWLEEIKEE